MTSQGSPHHTQQGAHHPRWGSCPWVAQAPLINPNKPFGSLSMTAVESLLWATTGDFSGVKRCFSCLPRKNCTDMRNDSPVCFQSLPLMCLLWPIVLLIVFCFCSLIKPEPTYLSTSYLNKLLALFIFYVDLYLNRYLFAILNPFPVTFFNFHHTLSPLLRT